MCLVLLNEEAKGFKCSQSLTALILCRHPPGNHSSSCLFSRTISIDDQILAFSATFLSWHNISLTKCLVISEQINPDGHLRDWPPTCGPARSLRLKDGIPGTFAERPGFGNGLGGQRMCLGLK